jgi:hypothetical protein
MLLVVGGGITGAGVFAEAALRGLAVGLVEQHDFASGTSSRSSKLIHGGCATSSACSCASPELLAGSGTSWRCSTLTWCARASSSTRPTPTTRPRGGRWPWGLPCTTTSRRSVTATFAFLHPRCASWCRCWPGRGWSSVLFTTTASPTMPSSPSPWCELGCGPGGWRSTLPGRKSWCRTAGGTWWGSWCGTGRTIGCTACAPTWW